MRNVSETGKDELEEAITLDELEFMTTTSKTDKSRGSNGFTNEFNTTFEPEIGYFFLDVMNFY